MPGDKVFDGRLKELRSLQNPGYVRLVTLMVGACSLRVKKVVGKNFNSTSLEQQCTWTLWKLWCRIGLIQGRGQDNVSFYLTRTYTALQVKTVPEYIKSNNTAIHKWTSLFCFHMKILKRKENNEKANPLLQESDSSFKEDCKFHLIFIPIEQNSALQLCWFKYLHWCQNNYTPIPLNRSPPYFFFFSSSPKENYPTEKNEWNMGSRQTRNIDSRDKRIEKVALNYLLCNKQFINFNWIIIVKK